MTTAAAPRYGFLQRVRVRSVRFPASLFVSRGRRVHGGREGSIALTERGRMSGLALHTVVLDGGGVGVFFENELEPLG